MSEFKRGINNKDFIKELNKNIWFQKMAMDKDLFIAIRNEYINVYYKGNSICELHFENSKIVGKTHYKYLLQPELKNPYIKSIDGIFFLENPLEKFITSLNDLNSIKKSSSTYSGEEKTGVHSISVKDKNVIDVEIAFSKLEGKTDRIDYLKLEQDNENLKLVFYEAKHFTNSEMRSSIGDPKVLKQIKKYENTLKENEREIIKSYEIVCKNLHELNLIKPKSDDFIKRVSEGENISIDYSPKLIIFGFDQDQRDGVNWKNHHKTLKDTLQDRLILRGNVN